MWYDGCVNYDDVFGVETAVAPPLPASLHLVKANGRFPFAILDLRLTIANGRCQDEIARGKYRKLRQGLVALSHPYGGFWVNGRFTPAPPPPCILSEQTAVCH